MSDDTQRIEWIINNPPLSTVISDLEALEDDDLSRLTWWNSNGDDIIFNLAILYNLPRGGKIVCNKFVDDIVDQFKRRKTAMRKRLTERVRERAREDKNESAKKNYTTDDFEYTGLDFSPKGEYLPTENNLVYILQHLKDLKLGYDTFTQVTYFLNKPWDDGLPMDRIEITMPDGSLKSYWRSTNYHISCLTSLLNRSFFPTTVMFHALRSAMDTVAKETKFDMYQEWVNALPEHTEYDTTHDLWMKKFLHCDESDEYLLMAERILTLSIIARALYPGFDCRFVIVIEGKQDIGKTRFARMLCFNEQFFDELDFSKEYRQHINRQIIGMAILELSEGGGVTNADQNFVKRTISAIKDRVREFFTRDFFNYDRRCVMVMTTNHDSGYLTDRTGNSRFVPVSCGDEKIDIDGLKAAWPSILAQAKYRFITMGQRPWVNDGADQELQIDALLHRERASQEQGWIVKEILPNYKDTLSTNGMPLDRIMDILKEGLNSSEINRKVSSTAVSDALRKLGLQNKFFRDRNDGSEFLPRGRYWIIPEKK